MARRQPTPKTTVPAATSPAAEFDAVVAMIRDARRHAAGAVNTTLIDLDWWIGATLSRKIAAGEWGEGTVQALAAHIRKSQPNVSGFSDKNRWRMRPVYNTDVGSPKLAPLVRELAWTHHLLVLSRCPRTNRS